MEAKPLHFIDESVEVWFEKPPILEKKPPCPDGFVWRNERFIVNELLSEWVDTERRGRMARNMQPQHAAVATRRGSWGVGKFYFRVRTQNGRCFELYYDRAPKDASHRKGDWTLVSELEAAH